MPVHLHRTRNSRNFTPAGAVYVGRPTLWSNPFERRAGIGHARSVILYGAWLAGQLDRYVLSRCRFSPAEIAALERWHNRLVAGLHRLRGRDLQCWCPPSSPWCHADVLLGRANGQAA